MAFVDKPETGAKVDFYCKKCKTFFKGLYPGFLPDQIKVIETKCSNCGSKEIILNPMYEY